MNSPDSKRQVIKIAVVIRFNTIIVRKTSIDATYPGGLDQYRRDVLPEVIAYYEDTNLTVANAMGSFYGYWDLLTESGLIHEDGGKVVDIVTADQANGIDPRCDWLEYKECCDYQVCWLIGCDSGYIVDFKPERFLRRVAQSICPECASAFKVGSVAQAVDIQEHHLGPLAMVQDNPSGANTKFTIFCKYCGYESIFDKRGQSVANGNGTA